MKNNLKNTLEYGIWYTVICRRCKRIILKSRSNID